MSAQIANLIVSLDEIDDDIACREADLEANPDDEKAAADLDDRERLDILRDIRNAYNEEGNKAFENASVLCQEEARIFARIIQDEKLLAGHWTLNDSERTASNWINLEADDMWDKFPDLVDLLEPSYHECYCFWEDCSQTLRFDDGSLTLRLPHDVAVQFIKDHGIVVGLDRLIDRRDTLAEKLNVANRLLAEMRALQ